MRSERRDGGGGGCGRAQRARLGGVCGLGVRSLRLARASLGGLWERRCALGAVGGFAPLIARTGSATPVRVGALEGIFAVGCRGAWAWKLEPGVPETVSPVLGEGGGRPTGVARSMPTMVRVRVVQCVFLRHARSSRADMPALPQPQLLPPPLRTLSPLRMETARSATSLSGNEGARSSSSVTATIDAAGAVASRSRSPSPSPIFTGGDGGGCSTPAPSGALEALSVRGCRGGDGRGDWALERGVPERLFVGGGGRCAGTLERGGALEATFVVVVGRG